MKLTCDLCGGELLINPSGAVCNDCGLKYDENRLQEKTAEQKPVSNPTPPVRKDPSPHEKPTVAEQKAQKKMRGMWIIFSLIGVATFIGGLMESGIVYIVCVVATLITLFIFKPWNVYGGNIL